MLTRIREKLIELNPLDLGPVDLLIFQPTPYCNLACRYCYLTEADKNTKGTMSLEIIEATLQQLRTSSLRLLRKKELTVVWHAGEPLVAGIPFYRSAFELIKRLTQDLDILVRHSLQTNGTLITDEWAHLFKEYDVKVGISVDGPEHLHNINRISKSGRGSFNLTHRGMEILKKHSFPFHTISVLTKDSLKHPEEMFSFFQSSGSYRACFNIEETEGANTQSSLSSSGQDDELVREFYKKYMELYRAQEKPIRVREFSGATSAILAWNKLRGFSEAASQEVHPFSIFTVAMNGDYATFSPEMIGTDLEGYGKMAFGNIMKDSIDDLPKNETFQKIWKDIREGIKQCRLQCKYYGVCGGGAPSNKFHEHKTFACTETNYCRLHKQLPVDLVLNELSDHKTPAENLI